MEWVKRNPEAVILLAAAAVAYLALRPRGKPGAAAQQASMIYSYYDLFPAAAQTPAGTTGTSLSMPPAYGMPGGPAGVRETLFGA